MKRACLPAFLFPNYGKYPPYDPSQKERSLADFQLVSYVLGECGNVNEVKENFKIYVLPILIPVLLLFIGGLLNLLGDRLSLR